MEITISNGKISQDGKVVGTAMKDFKYGYHPAVLVKIGNVREWFELDEPHMVYKIREHVQATLKGENS
jgi:hypothetical protein